MVKTLRGAAALGTLLAAAIFANAAPAFAQAPTDAQRSAIRSACRSDYMAHCSSVPPGGVESLQCLQKNMSSLAPGCQAAVKAVEPAAEPKAEAAPAAAPKQEAAPATEKAEPAAAKPAAVTAAPAAAPPPAAAPKATASAPANKPSSAQIAAIRSACRSDYPKVCAGVPTGGAPALQCLEKNKAKLSAGCEKAVAAAGSGTGAPAAGGAPAAAAATPAAAAAAAPAAPAAMVLRPMLPREEFFVLRSACGGDVRALCGGVPAGGGRIMQCLATQAASLSPACKDVLGQFAAR
jgi:hypothetical protein